MNKKHLSLELHNSWDSIKETWAALDRAVPGLDRRRQVRCNIHLSRALFRKQWKSGARLGVRSIMGSFGGLMCICFHTRAPPKRSQKLSARPLSSQFSTLFESGLIDKEPWALIKFLDLVSRR